MEPEAVTNVPTDSIESVSSSEDHSFKPVIRKKSKQYNNKQKCHNCQLSFEDLSEHLSKSLICKQTISFPKPSSSSQKGNNLKVNIQTNKTADSSVGSHNVPLPNSSNAYVRKSGQEKYSKTTSKVSAESNTHIPEPILQNVCCLGCGKFFKRLITHLKQKSQCQAFYNMEEVNNQKENDRLEKIKKSMSDLRRFQKEEEKESVRAANIIRTAETRKGKTEHEKESVRAADRIRTAESRKAKTEHERESVRAADRDRKTVSQLLYDPLHGLDVSSK